MTQKALNEPEYFESEKYNTMGPGIDFPMIMSYKNTENPNFKPYFYFLNGHNDVVYFSDANFREELTEDYEYSYFGISNNFGNKNSLLFNSFEYDNETNLYGIGSTFYNPKIGLLLKNLNYGKEAVPRAMQINIYLETINIQIICCMQRHSS